MAVRILQGDCRSVLATLPAASFDACIADPPYGDTSLTWDKQCRGWIPAVARVLKPAASVWVFGSMRFLAPLFAEMEAEGFAYSQDIVWEKQNGTGFHVDRFRRVHEHAVMFYRGAWADVYRAPQFTNDATARVVRRKERPAHVTGARGPSNYTSHDGGPRLQRSVIKVANEHGKAIHPTQKPLGIIAPLVRYSVPPDGSYVVPFAGSGSECLIASIEGMSATGVELNPDYAAMAERRITGDAPLFAHAAVE
jgi:site-specific DNA-methyltransferase (adenine-specific)